jgi:hypothetical protein
LFALVEHEIVVTPPFRPKCMKLYRLPKMINTEIDKQMKQLLEHNIVRESKSPMCSPLMALLTNYNSIRCVLDYRNLNSFPLVNALCLPDMEGVTQK